MHDSPTHLIGNGDQSPQHADREGAPRDRNRASRSDPDRGGCDAIQGRPRRKALRFVLLAIGGLVVGGCGLDVSCAETATCPPTFDDAGSDGAARDGSMSDVRSNDAASEISSDARSESPLNDAAIADRVDATIDVLGDRTADTATRDANGPDAGTPPDTSKDGRIDVDGSISDATGAADRDVASGNDANESGVADAGNPGLPDANGGADTASIDAADAADVGDAADACMKNACGGCTVLGGAPGASCGSCGTYTCSSPDSVQCNDPGLNACNGCAVLAGAPGASCGTCGAYACSGPNSVTCANDSPLNACGGCGVLTGLPGARCGSCGVYTCSGDKASVYCDHPDPLKVTQLAAGYFHTCALLANGAIRCWGYNGNGQLGDGSTVSRLTPTSNVLTSALVLGAGWGHTCAVMSSGGLRCWGYNGNGELGDGLGGSGMPDHDRHVPPTADTAGLSNVTAISLGTDQTCALSAGNAYCWGANYAGQLGDMGPARNMPGGALLGGVSTIGAGQAVTCVMSGGSPGCWGQHADEFQLSALVGSTFIMPPRGRYGCAIDGQGILRCFYSAELVQPPLGSVTSVGVGRTHVCAVSGGDVRCWGGNDWGQLGEPSTTTSERTGPDGPVIAQGAAAVVTGNDHSCALLMSGAVRCWGAAYTSTTIETPPSDIIGFCP